MNLVHSLGGPYRTAFEVVERKGRGHPDTVCDTVAESLSRRLALLAHERTGHLLHANVDKALLAGGSVQVDYGGGELLTPAKLVIAGRADPSAAGITIQELIEGMQDDLHAAIPDAPPGAIEPELWLRPPSPQLSALTTAGRDVPLANDTSFVVVSLPRTPLEHCVLTVEGHLNASDVRKRLPIGTDIKVMGLRIGERVELTVAAAVLAEAVAGPSAYAEVVDGIATEVRQVAAEKLGDEPAVVVNAVHDSYLTVTGSSAESGDDGQVGRGNGFGGLITPMRPTSTEATAGKNPVSHTGKTYYAVAHDIAQRLLQEAGAGEVTVGLLSRIGDPIDDPYAVQLTTLEPVEERMTRAILHACLADWQGVRDRLIAGDYTLF